MSTVATEPTMTSIAPTAECDTKWMDLTPEDIEVAYWIHTLINRIDSQRRSIEFYHRTWNNLDEDGKKTWSAAISQ
jgi:hypothetical protein